MMARELLSNGMFSPIPTPRSNRSLLVSSPMSPVINNPRNFSTSFSQRNPGSPVSQHTFAQSMNHVGQPNVGNPEEASSLVDRFISSDNSFHPYQQLLRAYPGTPSVSGNSDHDYPNMKDFAQTMSSSRLVTTPSFTPLPASVLQQFNYVQDCAELGLLPEIKRGWITIDSNFILWNYENGSDCAQFDQCTQTITGVGLVKIKPGVFKSHIKYILVLTTAVEIHLRGLMVSDDVKFSEVHIVETPLFPPIPTDNIKLDVIKGTTSGRIFLGGRDGNLYELVYDEGSILWPTKRCWKVNRSTSAYSTFIPSIFTFSKEDPVVQIEVDNSRNLLYIRSVTGSISVFDLGSSGKTCNRIITKSESEITSSINQICQTIDTSSFGPIVHINPIEQSESVYLSLLAITDSGVRLFFYCSQRNLDLIHIRLPPGFTGHTGLRPTRVRLGHYSRGTTLMLSPQSADNDMLWAMSNDAFPFAHDLTEISSDLNLKARVWTVVEEQVQNRVKQLVSIRTSTTDGTAVDIEPPMIVTQEHEEKRKFVFLSSNGIHIAFQPRPKDHLRTILLDNHGFDNDATRGFFALYGKLNAAAVALSLACTDDKVEVVDWATLAFFRYSKEQEQPNTQNINPNLTHAFAISTPAPTNLMMGHPQTPRNWSQTPFQPPTLMSSPNPHQGGPFLMSSPRSPVATMGHMNQPPFVSPILNSPQMNPHGQQQQQTMVQSPQQPAVPLDPMTHYSVRHNAIYTYFARIVRPIWFSMIAGSKVSDKDGSEVLNTPLTPDQLKLYVDKMKGLKDFLEKNIQLSSLRPHVHGLTHPGGDPNAQLMERISFTHLMVLLHNSLEVFGLFKCASETSAWEYVSQKIDSDTRMRLKSFTVKDMVLNGGDICAKIAQHLVQMHIDTNQTTDRVSKMLHDSCPSIFKQENALFAKANEIILSAKGQSDPEVQQKLIHEAVELMRKVGPKINLFHACELLDSVNGHYHMIDLCVKAAELRDPHNLGLAFYRNGQPENEFGGHSAFITRMECYSVLMTNYQKLIDRSEHIVQVGSRSPASAAPSSPNLTHSPGATFTPADEAERRAKNLITDALKINDELLHICIFDWLLARKCTNKLLSIKSPFLEKFLLEKSKSQGDSKTMMETNAMYYSINNQYRSAAEIYQKLAEGHAQDVNLTKRMEYLSMAIMCMKSQSTLGSVKPGQKHPGEFLKELEEKMEVALLQKDIYDILNKRPDVNEFLRRMDCELINLSDLYCIAETCRLHEILLKITASVGYKDNVLVDNLWKDIIDEELAKCSGQAPNTIKLSLLNKLTGLVSQYRSDPNYFPIEYVTHHAEEKTSPLHLECDWLAKMYLDMGVSLKTIVSVYNRILRNRGTINWVGKETQVMSVIGFLITQFLNDPELTSRDERRNMNTTFIDMIAEYCLQLDTMNAADPRIRSLMSTFKYLQTRLEASLTTA